MVNNPNITNNLNSTLGYQKYHQYSRYFTDLSRFYKTKKGRVYTGIIAALIAINFFIFFAIKPTLVTIVQLVKQVRDQKELSQDMDKKITALNSAQSEYSLIENQLYLVDQALPKKPDLTILIKELEALATKSQVAIAGSRISEVQISSQEKPEEGKQPIKFTFTAVGDYPRLKEFMSSLSNLRRIVTIEGFSFQNNKDNPGLLTLSIDAKAWYLEN